MPKTESTKALINRWQAGDQTAADALYEQYRDRLFALARMRIGKRLARRVEPDDILQSVFKSFFRRARAGEFVIDHSDSLWRLLVGITLNKIRRQTKRHHARRRSVEVEVDLLEDELIQEAVAREPSPEQAAALADELEFVLAPLDAPKRRIVTMCLQGYSCSEIAAELGCSRWTPRRVLDRIGQQLRRRLRSDDDT